MKKSKFKYSTILVLLFTYIFVLRAHAQNKYSNTWILGTLPNDIASSSGGTMLNFNTDPPQTLYFPLPGPNLGPFQSMSDKEGNLLFYTDGCMMFDREHKQMENGDEMNTGRVYERYCLESNFGYPMSQGFGTFPVPGTYNRYTIAYLSIDEENLWSKHLLYAEIDMNRNSGLGAVVKKNKVVMQDTALQNILSAIRHANGRDWWIIVQRAVEPYGIFTILLSPEGFSSPVFNSVYPHLYDVINGQACFSPDGSKYCYNQSSYIYIFDFDRCNGTFSNLQSWRLPIDNTVPFTAGGIAVSPNSEYVYVSTGAKLHQYELKSSNIEASRIILSETQFPQATFKDMALAPDGKIYGIDFGYSDRLHIIHQPNLKGDACHFEQHAFQLPTKTQTYLPYFPTYQLYDDVGSPCDTLCENDPRKGSPYTTLGIEVYPNPTRDKLKFKLPLCPCGQWEIFNIAGILVHAFPANSQEGAYYELDVSFWPSGVYVLRGKTIANEAYARRFVVVK